MVTMVKALTTGLKVAVVSCAGWFAYYTVSVYLKRRKYRHIPGPPTKGIFGFFAGNFLDIAQGLKEGKILSDLQYEW